jgi:hypothetical protein
MIYSHLEIAGCRVCVEVAEEFGEVKGIFTPTFSRLEG